jgi:membrane associated rhomboid family serine protease
MCNYLEWKLNYSTIFTMCVLVYAYMCNFLTSFSEEVNFPLYNDKHRSWLQQINHPNKDITISICMLYHLAMWYGR